MKLLSRIAAALVVLCLPAVVEAKSPPNVVWIIADDMSPDVGAYGAKNVKTPNLDKLAAEGRRYDHAYASAPVCSSSRSAFILGCYQTTTGLHAHDVENPQPPASPYRPLTELLRDAGWFVTNAPAPGSMRNGRPIKQGKTHYNFAHDPKTMFDGDDWRKRKPGQPFFAQIQITEPHRPFPIPETYDEAALAAIELPANYPDDPLMRRDWYAYLRSVETVDRRVGEVVEQLRAEGVLDETIVMFFADHGRPMPWGKQWLNVEGLQVPLIIRGPGIEAGGVERRPVSLIDLAPSILALAGRPVPEWMEGHAILSGDFPNREVIFAARDRCGDAQDRIRAAINVEAMFVRNFHPELSRLNWSSYKESSYPGMPLLRALNEQGTLTKRQAEWLQPTRGATEFYDLRTDKFGLDNVVDDAKYAEDVHSLQAALSQWIDKSGDKGALPDPPTEPTLAEMQQSKRADYNRVWKGRVGKEEPTDAERVEWWRRQYGLAP